MSFDVAFSNYGIIINHNACNLVLVGNNYYSRLLQQSVRPHLSSPSVVKVHRPSRIGRQPVHLQRLPWRENTSASYLKKKIPAQISYERKYLPMLHGRKYFCTCYLGEKIPPQVTWERKSGQRFTGRENSTGYLTSMFFRWKTQM